MTMMTQTDLNNLLVGVTNEPVKDDPHALVAPDAHELVDLVEHVGRGETQSAVDAGQVAQVEDVVELGRCRRQV